MVVVKKKADANRSARIQDTELVKKLFSFSVPLPNISRAKEVVRPSWIRERQPTANSMELTPRLSSRWSESDLKQIAYFRSLLTRPVAHKLITKIAAKIMLLVFAFLRILIAPGDLQLKLKWFIRSLNRQTIKKSLGG